MKQRTVVQLVTAVVVVVFAIGIWATGGAVHASWLRFFSAAVLVATAVLLLWDRVLWKTSPAQRFASVPRDVSGTWQGTLMSLWEDPESKRKPSPKTVYLVVRQTASAVAANLLTDESRSASTLASVAGADGNASLDCVYLNRPHSRFGDRSRIHHGALMLDISGRPARRLSGRYWTDPDSRGELDFGLRHKRTAEDYEAAAALF